MAQTVQSSVAKRNDPGKHLVCVHGAGRHFTMCHECCWESLRTHVNNSNKYRLEPVLWGSVAQNAECHPKIFPDKWVEILRDPNPVIPDLFEVIMQRNENLDRYLRGGRIQAINRFKEVVSDFLGKPGHQVDIVSQSLGTVLVYETLHELGADSSLGLSEHQRREMGSLS